MSDAGLNIALRQLVAQVTRNEQFRAREKVAAAMLECGAPTGHGDTIEDLLGEWKAHCDRITTSLVEERARYASTLSRCVSVLSRLSELTPFAANARTPLDLHHTVKAIADAALFDGEDAATRALAEMRRPS